MKSKRTALLTAGLTVLLCAAIIVGATFALFGTQKQREVTVTTGSVDIAAEFDTDSLTLYSLTPESTDAQPTDSLNFATGGSASIDGQNGSISLSQMVPGDKAEFTLTITNTGKSAARFRVDYTPGVTGVEGAEDSLNYAITAEGGGAFSFGTWAETEIAPGSSVTLEITVELDKDAEQTFGDDGAAEDFITNASIEFTIYAGQANASDADLNEALGLN